MYEKLCKVDGAVLPHHWPSNTTIPCRILHGPQVFKSSSPQRSIGRVYELLKAIRLLFGMFFDSYGVCITGEARIDLSNKYDRERACKGAVVLPVRPMWLGDTLRP